MLRCANGWRIDGNIPQAEEDQAFPCVADAVSKENNTRSTQVSVRSIRGYRFLVKFTKTFAVKWITHLKYTADDNPLWWDIEYEFPEFRRFEPVEAMECRWCGSVVYATESSYERDQGNKNVKFILKTRQICACAFYHVRMDQLEKETKTMKGWGAL